MQIQPHRRSFIGQLIAGVAGLFGFSQAKPAAAASLPQTDGRSTRATPVVMTLEDRLWLDLVLYGNAFKVTEADGRERRVVPRDMAILVSEGRRKYIETQHYPVGCIVDGRREKAWGFMLQPVPPSQVSHYAISLHGEGGWSWPLLVSGTFAALPRPCGVHDIAMHNRDLFDSSPDIAAAVWNRVAYLKDMCTLDDLKLTSFENCGSALPAFALRELEGWPAKKVDWSIF